MGTALPETIIPLIAIFSGDEEAGEEIGIGAILGAPFMLSTLAMFVCGMSVVIYTWTKKRTMKVRFNQEIMRRDLALLPGGLRDRLDRGHRRHRTVPLHRCRHSF